MCSHHSTRLPRRASRCVHITSRGFPCALLRRPRPWVPRLPRPPRTRQDMFGEPQLFAKAEMAAPHAILVLRTFSEAAHRRALCAVSQGSAGPKCTGAQNPKCTGEPKPTNPRPNLKGGLGHGGLSSSGEGPAEPPALSDFLSDPILHGEACDRVVGGVPVVSLGQTHFRTSLGM